MSILVIGAGASKAIRKPTAGVDYSTPVTLDIDPTTNPDVVWDLNNFPYPYDDNTFDEIHAYEVLEHCGSQGDWRFFFTQFSELWRMLKPDGLFICSVPSPESQWAWGDPGHTRIVHPYSLIFLSQNAYEQQIGKTSMTDYRHFYHADLEATACDLIGESIYFTLKAIK